MKGRKVKKIVVVPPWPKPVGGLPLTWSEWEEGVRRAFRLRFKSGAGITGTRP